VNEVVRPGRVLVAVDFGDASAAAVAFGGTLARASGATLTVLHAETIEMPPYFTETQVAALEAERQSARVAAEDYVREFARRQTSVPVQPLVVEGSAPEVILRAGEDFDVIVLGTHGRRGATRWWLGSVAEAVIRRSTVPVFVIRADARDGLGRFEAGEISVLAGSRRSQAEDGWLAVVRDLFNARVVLVPELGTCSPGDVREADLIVAPTGAVANGAALKVLRGCVRPVLFVPDKSGLV
jgi:nucleotide-binding universal stress UspA family protein